MKIKELQAEEERINSAQFDNALAMRYEAKRVMALATDIDVRYVDICSVKIVNFDDQVRIEYYMTYSLNDDTLYIHLPIELFEDKIPEGAIERYAESLKKSKFNDEVFELENQIQTLQAKLQKMKYGK